MNNIPTTYEQASETQKKLNLKEKERIKSVPKLIGTIGTAAVLPATMQKVLPFLSEFITPDMALKGISKVNPKIGDFLKRGMASGLDLKGGLDFIKENLAPSQSPEKQKNIIEQYSPELHQFLADHIQKGQTPLAAGALAQTSGKFSKEIKQLEKDHKTNWSQIIESVFGVENPQQTQQMQTSNVPQQTQQPQMQQQGGQGQQALLQAIQRLQQLRGGQ